MSITSDGILPIIFCVLSHLIFFKAEITMSLFIIPTLKLTVTHEHLDQIAMKYHHVEEDGVVIPGVNAIIDRPPSGKIDFYLYYFEVGLRVPPSTFFGQIIETYKIHTSQLKPKSISKIICFDLLCHTSLVVPMIDLFEYFFRICSSGDWFYFHSRGQSFIEGFP